MGGRRWATAWLVAVVLAMATGTGIRAQYEDGLPEGLTQITVDDQPIDASTTPEVATRTPVFAGRVVGETTEVELAIGNGEIVRFPLEVNPENGRFRGSAPDPLDPATYALYVNDALVGNFVVTEDAQADERDGGYAAGGATLDLARLVPYPFDLGEAYPGLAVVTQDARSPNRYYNLTEQARRQAEREGDDSREAIQALRQQYDAAGFRGLYELRLAIPAEDNPDVFSVQVNGSAIEYATAENARAEFQSTIEGQVPSEGGEPVENAESIGEESGIFRSSGVASSTGIAYQSATLVFRQERVVVRVDIADLRNREPALEVIEALGLVLQDQAAGVLADEIVPLSREALDLDLSAATGVPQVQQAYEAVDGNLIARYLEERVTLESRAASFAGATDVYTSSATASIAVPGFVQTEPTAETGDEAPQRSRDRAREGRPTRVPGEERPTRVPGEERPTREPGEERPTREAGERTPRAGGGGLAPGAGTPPAGGSGAVDGTPAAGGVVATPAGTPTAGGTVGESSVAYAVTLYAFPGEEEAEAWLAGLPERIDQDPLPGYLTFAPVEDASEVGDGSAAYSFDRRQGEETVGGFRYYVRVGAQVAALELAGPVEIPLDAVQGLAEAQAACLGAGSCPEAAPLPTGGGAEPAG